MSPDRTHVWYCQLGIGSFGSFNTETLKFETHVEFDSPTAGPRRMSMSEDAVLYLALYGAGQLAVYDTKADAWWASMTCRTAPAPRMRPPGTRYARWFGYQRPMPMSSIDSIRARALSACCHYHASVASCAWCMWIERSGALVTSYANIVEHVRGPRMALLIDPGDGAVKAAASAASPKHRSRRLPDENPQRLRSVAALFWRRHRRIRGRCGPGQGLSPLAAHHHCDECHAFKEARIGPPFVAVAARYATDKDAAVNRLAQKIINGGAGNWGTIPMVANERISMEDARAIARWILALGHG